MSANEWIGIAALEDQIGNAPGTKVRVAIFGETGTGKTLLARIIHHRSKRTGKFVSVNCSGPPSDLIDAELFGHAAGAFTGADKAREGKFRQAEGGTIFLDELGNMPRLVQEKLLMVLDDGEVQGLGEEKPKSVDVRIISATNAVLEDAVETGTFRKDLYRRLIRWEIHVPPLRQNPEQVLALATELQTNALKELGLERGRKVAFDKDAKEALKNHDWPGNTRELETVLQRLLVKYNSGGQSAAQPEKETNEPPQTVTRTDVEWAIRPKSTLRKRRKPRSENSQGEAVVASRTAEGEMQQAIEGIREKKRWAIVEKEYFDKVAEVIRAGQMDWKTVVARLEHGMIARMKGKKHRDSTDSGRLVQYGYTLAQFFSQRMRRTGARKGRSSQGWPRPTRGLRRTHRWPSAENSRPGCRRGPSSRLRCSRPSSCARTVLVRRQPAADCGRRRVIGTGPKKRKRTYRTI